MPCPERTHAEDGQYGHRPYLGTGEGGNPGRLPRTLDGAICAFATAVQHQVSTYNGLSRYPCYIDLNDVMLPNAALESDSSRPMAIYVISIILNLGLPIDIQTLTGEVNVGPIIDTLFSIGGSDVERNVVEENVVDLYMYSTLILLRSSLRPELDVEKLKGLIARVGKAIEVPFIQEFGAAGKSGTEIHTDLGRARWKAIYLSALLFKLLPGDQREGHKERLRARVQGLLESGGLSPADDYHHYLQPLVMEVSLAPIDGDAGQKPDRPWIFDRVQWLGRGDFQVI